MPLDNFCFQTFTKSARLTNGNATIKLVKPCRKSWYITNSDYTTSRLSSLNHNNNDSNCHQQAYEIDKW